MTGANQAGRLAASSEALTLFDQVETFAEQSLAGQVDRSDATRSPDRIALREAARLGLAGIEVPKANGGLGLGFREKIRVVEILSRSSMAFAFSLVNTQNVAARVANEGSDAHRNTILPSMLRGYRFGSTALTEPGAGSDFAAITTTATKSDDGWVLNGEKAWITNAAISDVVICYAQTDPAAGRHGIASFLIDGTRDGFTRHSPYSMHSAHAIGAGSFTLTDYQAEPEDLLAPPGEAFAAALRGVNGARIYVAAMATSMVRSALTTAVGYGTRRETFGRPLLDHQGLAWSLAEVANRLEAAKLLTGQAVDLYAAQEAGDEVDVAAVVGAAAHAKRFATMMVEPALAACLQAMGAAGLTNDFHLYRQLSDARVLSFVDGSTEMQTERIARTLVSSFEPDRLKTVSTAFGWTTAPLDDPSTVSDEDDTDEDDTVEDDPALGAISEDIVLADHPDTGESDATDADNSDSDSSGDDDAHDDQGHESDEGYELNGDVSGGLGDDDTIETADLMPVAPVGVAPPLPPESLRRDADQL